ncbi:MAG: hypothetical protein WBY44_10325, partial [Bryobacteraceae bacterium]
MSETLFSIIPVAQASRPARSAGYALDAVGLPLNQERFMSTRGLIDRKLDRVPERDLDRLLAFLNGLNDAQAS